MTKLIDIWPSLVFGWQGSPRGFEGEDYGCHLTQIGKPIYDQVFGQQVIFEAETVFDQDACRWNGGTHST